MVHSSAAAEGRVDGRVAAGRPTLRALRERLQGSRPELVTESATYRAALLLMAAPAIGQNVDRLALFTGFPREIVARCVRRLVDNGVWTPGQRPSALAETALESEDFWRNVGVAEGTLCRKVDDTGQPEWALAGDWWKSFEVGAEDEAGGRLVYQPRQHPAPPESLYVPEAEEEDEVAEVEPERVRGSSDSRPPSALRERSSGAEWMGGSKPSPDERVKYLGEPEQFRDTKWLA